MCHGLHEVCDGLHEVRHGLDEVCHGLDEVSHGQSAVEVLTQFLSYHLFFLSFSTAGFLIALPEMVQTCKV